MAVLHELEDVEANRIAQESVDENGNFRVSSDEAMELAKRIAAAELARLQAEGLTTGKIVQALRAKAFRGGTQQPKSQTADFPDPEVRTTDLPPLGLR
jgi:hypothetical protein